MKRFCDRTYFMLENLFYYLLIAAAIAGVVFWWVGIPAVCILVGTQASSMFGTIWFLFMGLVYLFLFSWNRKK